MVLETNLSNESIKQLTFKSHIFKNRSEILITAFTISRISITQWSIADQDICIPKIYISDSLNLNPNSIANVEKVL